MSNTPDLDLDVVRRCMLRGAITVDLDAVATANPVGRCMLVAKALHASAQACDETRSMLEGSRIMEALKNEAIERQTGRRVLPTSLTSSDGDRPAHKERSHV